MSGKQKACGWRGRIAGTRAASSRYTWHWAQCPGWESHPQCQTQNVCPCLAFCHVPFWSPPFQCCFFFFFKLEGPWPHLFFFCLCRINSWTLLTVIVFLPFPVKTAQEGIHQLILDFHVHKTSNKKGLGFATAALLGMVKVGSKERCSRWVIGHVKEEAHFFSWV